MKIIHGDLNLTQHLQVVIQRTPDVEGLKLIESLRVSTIGIGILDFLLLHPLRTLTMMSVVKVWTSSLTQ